MQNSEKLHDKWFGSLFFSILNSREFGHVMSMLIHVAAWECLAQ